MYKSTLTTKHLRTLCTAFFLFVTINAGLQAQSKLIEPKSRALWGSSKANCTDGSYLYLGAGGTVIIGAIESTDSIKILNEYYLPSIVQDISIRGKTLFVSDLLTGLHIIDVTDTFHPLEIGKLAFTQRSYGLLLDSTFLFMSHGENGISRVDISNENNPILVNAAGFPCTHFRIYSNYLFCISQDLITIAARSTLDSAGSLPLRIFAPFGNEIVGIEFSNTKGMLVENYFGDLPGEEWSFLTLLDISAPSTPARRGTLELPPQTSLKNQGDTLFCLTRDTIFTVNVDSIDHPFVVSRSPGITGDFVSLKDTMLFTSRDYFSEFRAVSTKDVNHPKKGFFLSTLADIGSILATDSMLIAGRFDYTGVMLVDIRDASNPRTRYSYTDRIGSVRDLRMGNGHVYAASQQGLKVFDVVGMDSLKLIGELNYGAWAMRMDVSDTIAALGGGYSQIHLISVADPSKPRYLLQVPSSSFGYVQNIFIRDTLLFVCGDYAGVRIYSISTPNQPVRLWERYYSSCEAICPIGNTLFVADYTTLRAFDISAPNNPTELGSFNLDKRIVDMSVRDSLAFVSVFSNGYTEDNGMVVLDVHLLNSIGEIARANTPGWTNAIFANDRHVFLSDHLDGVYIYDRSDIITTVSEPRSAVIPITFRLSQNYPNPFNPQTEIRYTIPTHMTVTLKIYDVLGKEVTTLLNEPTLPGSHVVRWDASRFASGVYFYRLQTNESVETKKLILLR